MKISVLKSIMRLFAIVSNVDTESVPHTEHLVKEYLQKLLNQSAIEDYFNIYRFYSKRINLYNAEEGNTIDKKLLSKFSVKILLICNHLNNDLTKKEKMILVSHLLEIIQGSATYGHIQSDMIDTMSISLNINPEDYADCKNMIIYDSRIINKDKLLYIEGEKNQIPDNKILFRENLDGRITIAHLKNTDLCQFVYHGNDRLFLDSFPITRNKMYHLNKGSVIRSAKIQPVYYKDVAKTILFEEHQQIRLDVQGVEYTYPGSDNGIKKFSFSAFSGELIGIMGGSGTGKSTLLSILNGTLAPDKGNVYVNGNDLYGNINVLKKSIGFIPQDDLLFEELTVRQNLFYNAQLCFRDFDREKTDRLVDNMLIDLDLYDISHLKVGTPLNKYISGGQRKRLNIALELIREPHILYVDEPTSGLSSSDSLKVMELFKDQTLQDKLVIINIHQPSNEIFKLFDRIIVLDKGGYPVYYGNPVEAVVYFKTISSHTEASISECTSCGYINPELILEILEEKAVNTRGELIKKRKILPQEWYRHFRDSKKEEQKSKTEQTKVPEGLFRAPNVFRQFRVFLTRNILSKISDKQYMLINLLEAPLLAAILAFLCRYSVPVKEGAIYIFRENENIPAFILMSVIVALFIGLTVSSEEIIRDRKILRRESFLNLSRLGYLHSKIIYLFVLSAFQSLTYVLVGNSILEIRGMIFEYWLILFSTMCFSNILGLNISAALKSVVSIYILVPLLLVPQILLSGVLVEYEKLHKSVSSYQYVPVIGDLMTSRWAYEAITTVQFSENEYQKHFFDVEQKISHVSYKMNLFIPELLNHITSYRKTLSDSLAGNNSPDVYIIRNGLKQLDADKYIMLSEHDQQIFNSMIHKDHDSFSVLELNILRNIISGLKKHYLEIYNQLTFERDEKIRSLKENHGKKYLIRLKNHYYNQKLAEFVLKSRELNRIVVEDRRLIQHVDPIYNYPTHSLGRAHFFAPAKKIRDTYIDTFSFNTIVIWMMILMLYVTLYYNALGRILNLNIKIFHRKSH